MRAATTTAWTKPSNLEVILFDPESALAGCTPAQAEKERFHPISASAENRDIGKLHLAGGDAGFGEFWTDAKTARLISAGLLCNDAANLIHHPAYAIDHEHTMHQLEDAEFYHPTKIEIISEIGDARCGNWAATFARANEQVVSGGHPGRQKAQRALSKSLSALRSISTRASGSDGTTLGAIVTLFRFW
jgi:hypothetical protein